MTEVIATAAPVTAVAQEPDIIERIGACVTAVGNLAVHAVVAYQAVVAVVSSSSPSDEEA